jgi:hypothetical protein
MRANGTILNPDKVEVEMTFTMTLGEWEAIAKRMGHEYPAWKFTSAIQQVARAVRDNVSVQDMEP